MYIIIIAGLIYFHYYLQIDSNFHETLIVILSVFFFPLKQVWSNFIFLLSSFRIFNLKLSQILHDRWIIPKFSSNACYKVLKIKWLSIVESFMYVEGCNLELYFYFSITFMVTIFVVWYVYQKCLRGDIVKFRSWELWNLCERVIFCSALQSMTVVCSFHF